MPRSRLGRTRTTCASAEVRSRAAMARLQGGARPGAHSHQGCCLKSQHSYFIPQREAAPEGNAGPPPPAPRRREGLPAPREFQTPF